MAYGANGMLALVIGLLVEEDVDVDICPYYF